MLSEVQLEKAKLRARKWRADNPKRARQATYKWQVANAPRMQALGQRWRAEHPDANRTSELKRKYNLTSQEADAILAWQNGMCAICLQPQSAKKVRFAVDHDHKTGLVRGRLCSYCNRIIAMFHDKPDKLQRAADYLLNPPAKHVIGDRVVSQKQSAFSRSKDARMFLRKKKLPDVNPPHGVVQTLPVALPIEVQ